MVRASACDGTGRGGHSPAGGRRLYGGTGLELRALKDDEHSAEWSPGEG